MSEGGNHISVDGPQAGHRLLPHTADAIVEAWAPTRAGCLRQAVRGLVTVFADVGDAGPSGRVPLAISPEPGESILMALLEEVIYQLDAADVVPVDAVVNTRDDGGLVGELLVVPAATVRQEGSVPKAISHHGFEFDQRGGSWHCRFTVDV